MIDVKQVYKAEDKERKQVVARIKKQFSGLLKEYFTDADNYAVTFPVDMDPKLKAILIGATILIVCIKDFIIVS